MYYNGESNNGVYVNSFSNIMSKVYGVMTLGLVITAIIMFMVYSNPSAFMFLYEGITPLFLVLAEFGLVYWLSSRVMKQAYNVNLMLFLLYSVLNGLTLSIVVFMYPMAIIYQAFFVTAIVFGIMSAYGYFTKKDLTGLGQLLFFGLIGIVVASIVNIFVGGTTLSLYISYAGLIIFLGLVAYDTQKIKNMYHIVGEENENSKKIVIFGALSLYLDFINIFIYLLRIFARSSRD